MDKKKLFALLIFLIMGFFMVSFANPSDQLRPVDTDTKESTPSDNANQTNVTPTRRTTTDTRTNQTIADNTTPVQNDATTDNTQTTDPTQDGTGNVSVTEYTVLFVDYANNVLKSQTVEEHASASADDIKVADYTAANITYSFKEWDKDFSDVTTNLTVKAVYDVQKIIAHVYINGEETDKTVEIIVNDKTKNKEDVDLTDDNIDDYIANKDDLPEEQPGKENEVDKLTYDEEEGYILEINEEDIDYTITATNGALVNGEEETIAHIGDEVTLSHIDKDGYEFEYYMVQDGDTVYITEETEITVNTDDIVVTAVYSTVSYKIEYVLNGGVFPEGVEIPREYTVESEDITLVNPTLVGYNFTGWTINNSNASTTVIIKKGSTGDRVYTAHFQARNDIHYAVERYTEKLNATSDEDKYEYLDTIEYNNGTADKEKEIRVDAIEGFTTPASQTVEIAANGSTVVRFNYDRIEKTVTFNVNGEEYSKSTLKYGETITVPTYNVAAGYTFSGWTNVAATMGTRDLVYNATYTPNTDTKYNVVVKEENLDGTYTSTTDVREGETDKKITVNAPAANTGFELVSDSSKEITITAEPTQTVEFTYNRVQRTVTFNVNGEEYSKSTLKYGADITVPTYNVAAGYTFSGWTNVAATMGTTDLTYNATYTANTDTKYTIEKYLENLNVTEETPVEQRYTKVEPDVTDTYTTDEELTVNAPTVEGFTATERSIKQRIAGDESTVFRFYYNRDEHTVTFNVNGEEYSKTTLKYGADITVPTYNVAAGYTFSGWTNVAATMGTTDLTYNATYTANTDTKYTVTIKEENLDGTYTSTSETRTGKTDDTVTVTVPNKTGFTVDANSKDVKIKGDETAEVVFTYTRTQNTVTFNVNGEEYSKTTLKYGADITVPTYNVAAGYTFSGWTNVAATMGTEDLVYNATYTANTNTKYTIEKYLENLNVTENTPVEERYTKVTPDVTDTYTTDEELTINAPEVEGFTATERSIKQRIAGDGSTVYRFYYNRNTVSVTFAYHEGSEVKTTKYEGSVEAPSIAQTYNENGYEYTFTGWDKAFNKVVSNITVNAEYSRVATEYTITYNLNGGSLAQGKTNPTKYTVEQLPLTINAPQKVGFNFTNWTDEKGNTITNSLAEGTTGNKTLTANYTARNDIKYTVKVLEEKLTYTNENDKYKVVDTTEYHNGTAEQNKELTAPAASEGFKLVGSATRTVKIAADGSTVVEFKYDRNTYTATYTINNEYYTEQSYKYGQTITKPSYTVATGYNFSGWTVDATMPASDKNYDATLAIKKFTVKWEIDGNIVETDENVEYGSKPKYDGTTPFKDGYTFLGWKDSKGNDETVGITENTTFKAQLVTLTAKIKANHQLSYTKSYSGNQPELVKNDITVTLVNLGGEDKVLKANEYTTDFDNTSFVKGKTLNITYTDGDLTLTNNKLKYSVIYLAYSSKFEVDVSIKNTYTYTKNDECMGTDGNRCDKEPNIASKTLSHNFLEVTEHYNQFVTVESVTVKYTNGSTVTLNKSDRVRWSYVETIYDISDLYVITGSGTVEYNKYYPTNSYTSSYSGYDKASGKCYNYYGCTYYTAELATGEYDPNVKYYSKDRWGDLSQSNPKTTYGYHDPVYLAKRNNGNSDVFDETHIIDTVTVRYHRDANEEEGETEGYFDVVFKYDPEVEDSFYCIAETEVN